MPEMRLTVRHLDPARDAMECTTPEGVTMTYDNPDTGRSGGSPMQHLLAAVGACALVDVNVVLRKKRLAYSNLRVECVGTRPEKGEARPFTDVKLVFRVEGAVPQKAFDDAVRLGVEKYCSVGSTVRHGAPIAWEAVISA